MKILQLAKKFPYPPKDGESIAIMNLSKSLSECGCEIDLLAMNTSRHHVAVERVKDSMDHFNMVDSVEVDNRIRPLAALSNLIQGKSYHISRFDSPVFKKKLIQLLQQNEYDVIQLETLYLAPYIDTIREHSNALVAMRAHNVEYEIWEKISENTTSKPKKWYLKKLTQQLKAYERGQLNEFDFLIAISNDDLGKFKKMGYLNGAVSTPVGMHLKDYSTKQVKTISERSIGFIGSLDWMPNVEGLQWFMDHIQPELKDVELHVAGRNTPDHLMSLNLPNVTIHGEVDNAHQFISQFSIMVVPLLSGSGMRVKILEAMALGRVVITTTKGAEGIGGSHLENLLIADTAEDFKGLIERALSDSLWSQSIGKKAEEFIKNHYDSKAVAEKLKLAYQRELAKDHSTK